MTNIIVKSVCDFGFIPGEFMILFQEFFEDGILQLNIKSGEIDSISVEKIVLIRKHKGETELIEANMPSMNKGVEIAINHEENAIAFSSPEMKMFLFQEIEKGNDIMNWIEALCHKRLSVGSSQLH